MLKVCEPCREMGAIDQFLWADWISVGVVVYMCTPLVFFFVTHNFQHIVWMTAVLAAPAAAEGMKRLSRFAGCTWCARPAGARDCDTWNRNGPQGGAPGFPSGHCATAAAFWSAAVLLTGDWRVGVAGCVAVVAMIWARLNKRCHTLLQTIGGTVLGAGVATILLAWNGLPPSF